MSLSINRCMVLLPSCHIDVSSGVPTGVMIAVSELWQFTEQPPAFRVLKPWWEVFMDVLSLVMLVISVFGCTLQVGVIVTVSSYKLLLLQHTHYPLNEMYLCYDNISGYPDMLYQTTEKDIVVLMFCISKKGHVGVI